MSDRKQDAWMRAETILKAYSNIKGCSHVYDVPDDPIRNLLVDILHYCHNRNDGKDPHDVYYLDFDAIVNVARRQFITEGES